MNSCGLRAKKTEKKERKTLSSIWSQIQGQLQTYLRFTKEGLFLKKTTVFSQLTTSFVFFFYLDVIPFDISLDVEDLYFTESVIKSGLST